MHGVQAAHPTDRAVDHHWRRGQGQNPPCKVTQARGRWCAPRRGKRSSRSAVSSESPRWGLCVWDVDPWGGGRIEDALASAGRVPRDVWCTRHSHTDGLRPGWLRHGDPEGSGSRGCQTDRHPAQGQLAWSVAEAVRETVRRRARQDRRDHWHPEDGQIWIQQAHGTSVAHAGDGRPRSIFLTI